MTFSLESYRMMLETGIASGYQFRNFGAAQLQDEEYVCLLRHDVDADVNAALKMARIEHSFGLRSTFFLMTRSPLYNLMGRFNHQAVLQIAELGHWIGLHYDQGFNPGYDISTEDWIEFEANLIERMFNIRVEVVSFHQPGSAVMQGKVSTGRRINTYSKDHLPGFHYISDSNRQWRDMHPAQVFSTKHYRKLQLLIHPMWWVYGEEKTTSGVWDSVIQSNFLQSQNQLIATEGAYGVPRKILIQYESKEK